MPRKKKATTEKPVVQKPVVQEPPKDKYDGAEVGVIQSSLVEGVLKTPFTGPDASITLEINGKGVAVQLRRYIREHMTPLKRSLAEDDPSFKQVIPYVILKNYFDDTYYCVTRLGGDSRLVGGTSIGIGGHLNGGEDLYEGLYREVAEEVGLGKHDFSICRFSGYILDSSTPVNSVHLGLVFVGIVKRADIHCLEKDKLTGEWVDVSELEAYRKNGSLESWSVIAYDHLIR